ncbi:MAG: hypothetical protein PHT33_02190 [bacterium]|nr:hypothetical protein [bacterium]
MIKLKSLLIMQAAILIGLLFMPGLCRADTGKEFLDLAYWRGDHERAEMGWVKESGLPVNCGGSLHVYLKNPSGRPLRVSRIKLMGEDIGTILTTDEAGMTQAADMNKKKPLETMPAHGNVIWYRVYPNPVEPGQPAQIIIRLRKKPAVPTVKVKVDLEGGKSVEADIPLVRPRLWLSYIMFADKLDEVYVYVRKLCTEDMKLGKIYLDGTDVTDKAYIPAPSFVKAAKLSHPPYVPGPYFQRDMALVKINLGKPLKEGSFHVIGVSDQSGREKTAYMVRVMPAGFMIGTMGNISPGLLKTYRDCFIDIFASFGPSKPAWWDWLKEAGMKGAPCYSQRVTENGRRREISYGVPNDVKQAGDKDVFAYFLSDEPDGSADYFSDDTPVDNLGNHGMQMANADLVCRIADPVHPTFLQISNTYRPENYWVYGEVADINGGHRYYYPLMDSAFVAAMQKDACAPRPTYNIPHLGTWSETDVYYPSPETERIWVYDTLALGGKGIFWYPPHGGILNTRKDAPAGKAHKVQVWSEVGRLNAEMQMVGSLLVTGEPLPLARVNVDTIEPGTIVCGESAVVLVLVNRNYIEKLSEPFSYRPAKKVKVTLRLPAWIKAGDVFMVDANGPRRILCRQEGRDSISLTFDRIVLTKMVVIANDRKLFDKINRIYLTELKPGLDRIAEVEKAALKEAGSAKDATPAGNNAVYEERKQDVEAVLEQLQRKEKK